MLAAVLAPMNLTAQAAEPAPAFEPPIVYVDPCPAHPDIPVRVEVVDTIKGPIVRLQWQGAASLETHDANLAHKSRRFFFQLRTADTLIEFQGHATPRVLDGLISDEHGTRPLILPVASAAPPNCGHQP